MNFNALRKQPQSGLTVIVSTLMAIAAISLVAACSPTPTAAETAAQTQLVVDQAVAATKKEMIAEKEQQDAAAAAKVEEKNKLDAAVAAKVEEKNNQDAAVAHAVANERKKVASEQRAAKNAQRASAARSDNYSSRSTQENTSVCHNCGIVQSVNEIDTEGDGSALGVIAGALAK